VQIAVLGNPESWYAADLQRAAEERGHRLRRIAYPRMAGFLAGGDHPARLAVDELDLTKLDAVIVRTMPPGSLEQIVFRMDILARLESSGVIVLNGPKAIECAVDKFLTTAKLAAAGLPTPSTYVCEKAEQALEAFAQLGGDVVVKPIFGAEGRGIVRVSDPDLAFRTFRTLERIGAVLYLQQFIEHGGSDVRLLLLDGEVIGGMRRFSKTDFRVNVSRQGTAEPYQVSRRECELARLAATATAARFCGVDLLYDGDGRCHVIEVNAIPGWRAFRRVTGIDVAAALVARLEADAANC